MNILKLIDGDLNKPVNYSEVRLKQDNPNVSFPSPLNDRILELYDCFVYVVDPKPDYNSVLQDLNSVFEYRSYPDFSKEWVQTYEIVDVHPDVAKMRLTDSITSDRWQAEQGGVEWTDSSGDLWLIGTDENSQIKMTSVLSMLNADPSTTGYASWKMDKKVTVTYTEEDEEGNETEFTEEVWQKEFRHNTLDDWNEMVSLVSTHIKNCFTAEENALAKADAGDLTVTFQSEYEKL